MTLLPVRIHSNHIIVKIQAELRLQHPALKCNKYAIIPNEFRLITESVSIDLLKIRQAPLKMNLIH